MELESQSFKTGWLSPEANFYPCPNGKHDEFANEMNTTTHELECKGWVQVVESEWADGIDYEVMCVSLFTYVINHLQVEWCDEHDVGYDKQYIRG